MKANVCSYNGSLGLILLPQLARPPEHLRAVIPLSSDTEMDSLDDTASSPWRRRPCPPETRAVICVPSAHYPKRARPSRLRRIAPRRVSTFVLPRYIRAHPSPSTPLHLARVALWLVHHRAGSVPPPVFS